MKYLIEIKNRIFLVMSNIIILTALLLYHKDSLLFIVIKPIIDIKISLYLLCTHIIEAFTSYWYIIWIVLLHFFFIFISIQICAFFLPSLYKIEKKVIKLFFLFYFMISTFLITLFYQMILPFSWNFFYRVIFSDLKQQKTIKLFFEIKINEYLTFYFTLYCICFILSHLFFILTIKLYYYYRYSSFKHIKNYRKKLYFFFFIFSTLITPPDIISQLVIGFNLIVLFEFIIILIIFIHKFLKLNPIKTY